MDFFEFAFWKFVDRFRNRFLKTESSKRQRGTKSTWKKTVPPKEPIPTWNYITSVPARLSDPPKIKFPVHSHLEYILQKVFKMTGVKLTICRLSLIGIYWYQSTNRFINSHLFMHSHKGSLSIDLMIKPPWWEYISKLEN